MKEYGLTYAQIAEKYGCTTQNIYQIIRTYKNNQKGEKEREE